MIKFCKNTSDKKWGKATLRHNGYIARYFWTPWIFLMIDGREY